jgi:hypothetical protein
MRKGPNAKGPKMMKPLRFGRAAIGIASLILTSGASATTRYVDLNCTNASSPFTDWTTAATNIQDAIDASVDSDLILVTNGVYATGGRVMAGDLTNRVALNKALTVQSVNGPFATVILGAGATNGTSAVRCAWLTNGASLVGFTLQAGATRITGSVTTLLCGGGAWCWSSSAIVANCLIVSNTANYFGGGAYQGTLNNCLLRNNRTDMSVSGAASKNNLNSCTVVSNFFYGVDQAQLTNCIVYSNWGGNSSSSTFAYSCTTPLASGPGNFTNEPQVCVDGHIASTSPCHGAGTNLVSGTDIFGRSWLNPPAVGCAEWDPAPVVAAARLQLTCAPAGFTVNAPVLTAQAPFTNFWVKDGVPLLDDGHFSSSQTTNLVATGFRPTDAGAYQLVVSNAFGVVTSAVAILVVHYANAAGVSPATPYSTWATAATNIQDAIDAALAGEVVLVTNGIYAAGGKAMSGTLTNRVALTKPITVWGVNGSWATVIQGAWDPASTNGPLAVRCAWLTNGAVLGGFTLKDGATQASGSGGSPAVSGGGAWCSSTNAVVSNCVLTNNAALYGGGIAYGTLNNSLVVRNMGSYGGGAYFAVLNNCTVVFNYTPDLTRRRGAGTYDGTIRNSIVVCNYDYYLYILQPDDYATGAYYLYSCTSTNYPKSGTGNINGDNLQWVDGYHISSNSSCRGTASPLYSTGTDFDGEPWANPPSMGCDEVVLSNLVGPLSVAIVPMQGNLIVNHYGIFNGYTTGRVSRVQWAMGDGAVITNTGSSIVYQWTNTGDFLVTFTAYNTDNPGGVSTNLLVHVLPVNAPQLQSARIASNAFQFQFTGQVGANYTVQFATNLAPPAYWQTLQYIYSSPGGLTQISDSGASNSAARFYRVQAQ